MGGKKKPKIEIVGMGPDISALVIDHLVATGRPQIAKCQPVMNQLLFRSDMSTRSTITQRTIDELSAESSSVGSRSVKKSVEENNPQSLLRQDTHSTRPTQSSDDESDIIKFLDSVQGVIAEKSLRYDSASIRDFESELSRSIRSHFRDSEDDCDSLSSASTYSGYSADEIASHESVTNSLFASETPSSRRNGRVIARKKTWAELRGNRTKGQDEVSIKTEDAWDNIEQTVDDLAFALAIETHKGGILSRQLSHGKIRRVSPSKHDSPHRHDTEVKEFVSKVNDSELTQSTSLQSFNITTGAQDYRHDMPQGASPSRSHDGREVAFAAPSSPAPDAQDEPPSDEEETEIIDYRLGATPALYDGERFDRQISLSIDDSAERSALLDLNFFKSASSEEILSVSSDEASESISSIDDSAEHSTLPDLSFFKSASFEEILCVSFDEGSEVMSIDDVSIEQMSAAFSSISVDSGSQNITSRHVENGTISEDLDQMVDKFLTEKIERLAQKLDQEKTLQEKGQVLNGTHHNVNKSEEMISSQAQNTNLSSKFSDEKMQSDGHHTSNNLEPSLNDISGDSDFAVFRRNLNEPTDCLSDEMQVQRIQRKLSFDEELQLKGRDLIRRIREKRKGLIVSDLKGDPMDRVQISRDSPPSPWKSKLTRSSPERQPNERPRVADSSDGLMDLIQRPRDSHSSPRKSGLALLSPESQSGERSRSNLSEVKPDQHHEQELVSFLTKEKRAPRSPPTMSKPRRKKLKRRIVVLDMAHLSSSKNKTLETFHKSVDEPYEDRQEVCQQSKRTFSAAPEMMPIKDRARYNDGDELKRSRPDSHHELESNIPCPLKSPTKKFGVKVSFVDDSSPPPMRQSTPDSGNRRRGKDNSFLASELCSGYQYLSPPSPESPIGEFSMSMVEEASEYDFELCENSIVSTGGSNNRKERRGKVVSPCSQSPESSHRIKAKASSDARPPVINFNDSFDDIILRHSVEKSDRKQGQRCSPTSVFDCFEPAKDPVLQTSSESLGLWDHNSCIVSSGSLAFVDDQEGDPLFLDDDEDFWASNSIVGSDNMSLPTNSLAESEYCPPGVGTKACREHGMLSRTRFEI